MKMTKLMQKKSWLLVMSHLRWKKNWMLSNLLSSLVNYVELMKIINTIYSCMMNK